MSFFSRLCNYSSGSIRTTGFFGGPIASRWSQFWKVTQKWQFCGYRQRWRFFFNPRTHWEVEVGNYGRDVTCLSTKTKVFPKIEVPQNGWFIMENPIKMDDLGVPLFLETPTNTFKQFNFQLSFKILYLWLPWINMKTWMISNFNLRCRCFYTRRGPAKGAIDVWRLVVAPAGYVVPMEWGWQQPAFGKCLSLNHLRFYTINVQMEQWFGLGMRLWDFEMVLKFLKFKIPASFF